MSEDVIEELRESYKKYGPIRKIRRTQFGIASGNTRKKAVPEWPEELNEVKDYYEHLQIMAADNISEPKKPEWWAQVLSEAARELEKQGIEKGKIVARLEQDFPLSKASIYRYLPKEFKEPEKAEAGRLGGLAKGEKSAITVIAEPASDTLEVSGKLAYHGELNKLTAEDIVREVVRLRDAKKYYGDVTIPLLDMLSYQRYHEVDVAIRRGLSVEEVLNVLNPPTSQPVAEAEKLAKPTAGEEPESEKKEPYSKGLSPRASEFRQPTYTKVHTTFASTLNRHGLFPDIEHEVVREGELNSDGRQKTYSLDLWFKEGFAVEIEGSGSASRDNPERDEFLKDRGIPVIHLSNKLVEDYGEEVAELMAVLLKLPRVTGEKNMKGEVVDVAHLILDKTTIASRFGFARSVEL